MLTIDPKSVAVPVLHSYLQSAVAPRPIAFVSSIDADGNVNLSPFSFFNVFGTNPPTLVFSPNRRVRDGSSKHTHENVLDVPEVTINMVDYAMVEQMSLASCEYPRGVDEFVKSGFTPQPSVSVKPPRVAESKAVFECKVVEVIQMGQGGGAPNLVVCEVILAHFDESILNEQGLIDQRKTDWVARMGGDWYARASGPAMFEVAKPNIALGIGYDAIPVAIRHSNVLTGNDLGKLGNIEALPTDEEVKSYAADLSAPLSTEDLHRKAQSLLAAGKVKEAWMLLLQQS